MVYVDSVEYPSGQQKTIRFDPLLITIDNQPLYVPIEVEVTISNLLHDKNIEIFDISCQHESFSLSIDKRVIIPRSQTSFNISFLPIRVGLIEQSIYISTNLGHFEYTVYASGVLSDRHMLPVLDVAPDSVTVFLLNIWSCRISIENTVVCQFAPDKRAALSSSSDRHLCSPVNLASQQSTFDQETSDTPKVLHVIAPYKTVRLGLQFSTPLSETTTHNYLVFDVKRESMTSDCGHTEENYSVFLPLQASVRSDLNFRLNVLNFGFITDQMVTIPLEVRNRLSQPVRITNIKSTSSNVTLSVELVNPEIPPQSSDSSSSNKVVFHKVATLTASSAASSTGSSFVSGVLTIRTNLSSDLAQIPYCVHICRDCKLKGLALPASSSVTSYSAVSSEGGGGESLNTQCMFVDVAAPARRCSSSSAAGGCDTEEVVADKDTHRVGPGTEHISDTDFAPQPVVVSEQSSPPQHLHQVEPAPVNISDDTSALTPSSSPHTDQSGGVSGRRSGSCVFRSDLLPRVQLMHPSSSCFLTTEANFNLDKLIMLPLAPHWENLLDWKYATVVKACLDTLVDCPLGWVNALQARLVTSHTSGYFMVTYYNHSTIRVTHSLFDHKNDVDETPTDYLLATRDNLQPVLRMSVLEVPATSFKLSAQSVMGRRSTAEDHLHITSTSSTAGRSGTDARHLSAKMSLDFVLDRRSTIPLSSDHRSSRKARQHQARGVQLAFVPDDSHQQQHGCSKCGEPPTPVHTGVKLVNLNDLDTDPHLRLNCFRNFSIFYQNGPAALSLHIVAVGLLHSWYKFDVQDTNRLSCKLGGFDVKPCVHTKSEVLHVELKPLGRVDFDLIYTSDLMHVRESNIDLIVMGHYRPAASSDRLDPFILRLNLEAVATGDFLTWWHTKIPPPWVDRLFHSIVLLFLVVELILFVGFTYNDAACYYSKFMSIRTLQRARMFSAKLACSSLSPALISTQLAGISPPLTTTTRLPKRNRRHHHYIDSDESNSDSSLIQVVLSVAFSLVCGLFKKLFKLSRWSTGQLACQLRAFVDQLISCLRWSVGLFLEATSHVKQSGLMMFVGLVSLLEPCMRSAMLTASTYQQQRSQGQQQQPRATAGSANDVANSSALHNDATKTNGSGSSSIDTTSSNNNNSKAYERKRRKTIVPAPPVELPTDSDAMQQPPAAKVTPSSPGGGSTLLNRRNRLSTAPRLTEAETFAAVRASMKLAANVDKPAKQTLKPTESRSNLDIERTLDVNTPTNDAPATATVGRRQSSLTADEWQFQKAKSAFKDDAIANNRRGPWNKLVSKTAKVYTPIPAPLPSKQPPLVQSAANFSSRFNATAATTSTPEVNDESIVGPPSALPKVEPEDKISLETSDFCSRFLDLKPSIWSESGLRVSQGWPEGAVATATATTGYLRKNRKGKNRKLILDEVDDPVFNWVAECVPPRQSPELTKMHLEMMEQACREFVASYELSLFVSDTDAIAASRASSVILRDSSLDTCFVASTYSSGNSSRLADAFLGWAPPHAISLLELEENFGLNIPIHDYRAPLNPPTYGHCPIHNWFHIEGS